MDIAALSVASSQTNVQQAAGISVMKMAMNVTKEQGDAINQLVSAPAMADPNLGQNIDLLV